MKFILLTFFFHLSYFSYSNDKIKALIGGTLIDGFGSIPIKNSVIIIEGEKRQISGEGNKIRLRQGGGLADIAPTLLELLSLPKPESMSGYSLIETIDTSSTPSLVSQTA